MSYAPFLGIDVYMHFYSTFILACLWITPHALEK